MIMKLEKELIAKVSLMYFRSIFFCIILLELTIVASYFVIKSANNNSTLLSELRKIRGLLNDIKDNKIKVISEEDTKE